MNRNLVVISNTQNPYENHAIEELLFFEFDVYDRILFLWTNEPSVVFGRHQNPWKELDVELAKERQINLIRRLSGGGTVYHDNGNLNFSFIENGREDRSELHFKWLIEALSSFGIEINANERKDLLLNGQKVSGNAFYLKGNRRLHHGTLLITTSENEVWQVLKKKDGKFKTRGISSVTSKVTNLQAVNPEISVTSVENSIVDVFYRYQGYQVDTLSPKDIREANPQRYEQIKTRLKSWEWVYGETPPFTFELNQDNRIEVVNGFIQRFTGQQSPNHLLGKPFSLAAISGIT